MVKKHDIYCYCLFSIFPVIGFEVYSLKLKAFSNKASLSILSAFVCQEQLSENTNRRAGFIVGYSLHY